MSVKLFVFIVLFGITLAFPTEFAPDSIIEKGGGDVIIIIRKIREAHQPQPVEGVTPNPVKLIDEQILRNDKNMGSDLTVGATQDGHVGAPKFYHW